MADQDGGGEGGENIADFVTRKVGPFPVWAYGLLFVGAWYYLERRKSAAASSTSAAAGTTVAAASTIGTDPAGNTGEIDPETGYVYGSSEDLAALQQQTSSTSSSGQYSDNNAWATAAINYLVGLGDDPTVANTAIEAYLGSQTLTVNQQALVNSAVQALGAPPQPPSPSQSTGVVAPPGGATTYATNPPTGLTASATTATSATLKWNAAANATGYTVTATPSGSPSATPVTVTVTSPLATVSGLTPQTSYSVTVQATPADTGAPSATTTFSTAYGAVGPGQTPVASGAVLSPGQQIAVQVNLEGKTVTQAAAAVGETPQTVIAANPDASPPITASTSTGVIYVPYLVKKGDTLTSIAAKFGISPEHLSEELAAEGVS